MNQNYIEKVKKALEASAAYYNGTPHLTDPQYDALVMQIKLIEATLPVEEHLSNSPTKTVGSKVSSINSIKWKYTSLSLFNVFSLPELKEFFSKVPKGATFLADLKFDGGATKIAYEGVNVVAASTRGDGVEGEDITHNIRTLPFIPHVEDANLGGETIMRRSVFDRINSQRIVPYANPRNLAANSLKLLDPKEFKGRQLDFIPYTWYNSPYETMKEDYEVIRKSNKEPYAIFHTVEEVWEWYEQVLKERNTLDYDIDGVVVTVNEKKHHAMLGTTERHPKYAVAIKFPAKAAETTITSIEVNVGRTGIVAPVAKITPVFIGGVVVESVTLHNADEIQRLGGICIGDTVEVIRAGDVIPKIVSVTHIANHLEFFEFPTTCPSCDSQLVKKENKNSTESVAWYCVNDECPGQVYRSILHAVKKQALDIEGLGKAIVAQLLEANLIEDWIDLFDLSEDQFLLLDRFGEQKAYNTYSAIQATKYPPLANFICALQIEGVGEKVSKDLASKFKTLEAITKAHPNTIKQIKGIDTAAMEIYIYFHSEKWDVLKEKLEAYGVEPQEATEIVIQNSPAKGKKFCVTGTLPSGKTRDEFKAFLERQGAIFVSSVSKKLDFLVVGSDAGSKLEKANSLGVKVYTETEILAFIDSNT